MIDHLQDAADAAECDLDLTVERMFLGYRLRPDRHSWPSPSAPSGPAAMSRRRSPPAAASDINSFIANGFAGMCLADGTERNHEPGERISATALEDLLELAIALVDEAAAELMPATERVPRELVRAHPRRARLGGQVHHAPGESTSATTTARKSAARSSGTRARSGSSRLTRPTCG